MNLMPGKYQFEYNIGNADIRIYDIFPDGQIQERVAKTNDVRFVSTETALKRLHPMISLAKQNKERYKNTHLLNKISKTKLDILLTIQQFMMENYINEDEVRLV